MCVFIKMSVELCDCEKLITKFEPCPHTKEQLMLSLDGK